MIYAWTTIVPMIYMVVTVFDAGIWSVRWNYLPKNDYLKVSMIIIMLALVVVILIDCLIKWKMIITARNAGKSMATVSKSQAAK